MQEMQETWVWSLVQGDPVEKEMATHFSVLDWEAQGQKSLGGYNPGSQSQDKTEHAHVLSTSLSLAPSPFIGLGAGRQQLNTSVKFCCGYYLATGPSLLYFCCKSQDFCSLSEWGLPSSCGTQVSHCSGFSYCGGQALEHTDLVAPQHVESSQTEDRPCVPCLARWILNHWATRKVHN